MKILSTSKKKAKKKKPKISNKKLHEDMGTWDKYDDYNDW